MGSNSDIQAWVADPLVKITPDAARPADAPDAVRIDAVANEYESGQIIVCLGARIQSLTANVGEFSGPDGSKPQAKVDFLGYVPVRKGTVKTPDEHLIAKPPVDLPDPLLEDASVSVEAGRNQPIWVTVYVPKNVAPGDYSADVEIAADGQKTRVPVSVKVHAVTLPDTRTLQITQWFRPDKIADSHGIELWSEPFWEMLEVYAKFLAEYRQNVAITPIQELITGRDDGSGNLTFDFSLFDRWVDLFKEAGVLGTIEGRHLGGRSDWEAPDFDAQYPVITNPDGSVKPDPQVKVTSEEYKRFLSQFLPALQDHLESKGLLDCYVQHLVDEPIPENAASYRTAAGYIKQFAPKLRIVDACMCSELAGFIDIWVPQPKHFGDDIEFFKSRQAAGDQVWFYTCLDPKEKFMNRFIDYPLLDVRLMHWVNFKYDLPGYLHWGFNYWTGDPFKDLEPDWPGVHIYLPPGDTHIAYPGKRGPLSSIRQEAMRDGIEDYELLKLLEKKNPKLAREICDSVVRSLTDYSLDPAEFRKARARLIDELESATAGQKREQLRAEIAEGCREMRDVYLEIEKEYHPLEEEVERKYGEG